MTKKNKKNKKALKVDVFNDEREEITFTIKKDDYVAGSILEDDERKEEQENQPLLDRTFSGYTNEMTIDPELYENEKLTLGDKIFILIHAILLVMVAILFAPLFFLDLYMRAFLKNVDINYSEELKSMKNYMRESNYRKRMEIDKK